MTVVFTTFAALFSLGGWLMPHVLHRLGYRMAAFYLAMAAIAATITLMRRSSQS